MMKYDPEMFTFFIIAIKNITLVACTAITVVALFYFSRSWWSLLAILMLAFLSSGNFTRD
jgi:hypothetical protein